MKEPYHRIPEWFEDARNHEQLFRETLQAYFDEWYGRPPFLQGLDLEMGLETLFAVWADLTKKGDKIFDFRAGPWSGVVNPHTFDIASLFQGQALLSMGEIFDKGYGIARQRVEHYNPHAKSEKSIMRRIFTFTDVSLSDWD